MDSKRQKKENGVKLNPLQVKGIIPPLLTPLLDGDQLDLVGLSKLIERVLEGGCSSLFILGTTGEGPHLSYHLRKEMISHTCTLVKGRVPILVGITDTSYKESLQIAQFAYEKGASAVVLAPPYYFPAGQTELLQWLNDIVPQLPLPCFLYNIPSLIKVAYEVDTVLMAMDLPGVVGIKDSSGDMTYFHKLIQMTKKKNPNFIVLMGSDALLHDSVYAGGDGGVCGTANLVPRLFVDLYEASVQKDHEKVQKLHRRVIQLIMKLYSIGKYDSKIIKGLKSALSILGICNDTLVPPFHAFKEPEREKVLQVLREEGITK